VLWRDAFGVPPQQRAADHGNYRSRGGEAHAVRDSRPNPCHGRPGLWRAEFNNIGCTRIARGIEQRLE
jgi:hypothetical protein